MMTTDTERKQHLASHPEQDGRIVLKTSDGETHTYDFSHGNSWSMESYGVMYKNFAHLAGQPDRSVFPWTNVVWYRVHLNSEEYHAGMIGWLKLCDHEWLTHPQVGHYCRHCRLDMKDMASLYEDKFTETPMLVTGDPTVDRDAGSFDGAHDVLTGVADPVQAISLKIVKMLEDPLSYCECEDDSTPHDGKCRVRPDTWPIAEVEPDEDDNREY